MKFYAICFLPFGPRVAHLATPSPLLPPHGGGFRKFYRSYVRRYSFYTKRYGFCHPESTFCVRCNKNLCAFGIIERRYKVKMNDSDDVCGIKRIIVIKFCQNYNFKYVILTICHC